MVSRRRISKNTESERNSNLVNQFLINFVGIDFRDSTVSGVKKGIKFRDFGQIPQNPLNFLPAKMSSLKFLQCLINGGSS